MPLTYKTDCRSQLLYCCFTAALRLHFFKYFLADGLDCFAVAEKWGYKNISLLLKAYVEKARITELANDAGTCFIPVGKH